MKKVLAIAGCLVTLHIASVQQTAAHPRQDGSFGVSFSVFYDELSPHGEWIPVGGGVYGWRPIGVAGGWRPYTVGRWCWTSDGWYWLSYEPWGWAVFHYGRWHYDDYYGWIWMPGYDWAPAWVEWRYGPDYVGWAPLSPYAVFSISWGIHYRTRWYTPVHWWNFVPCGYVAHHNVHRYVYRSEHNTRYVGVTRGGGSVRYDGGRIVTRGPDREYIERRGNVRLEQVRVRDVHDRPVERVVRDGNIDQIEVYRPRIQDRVSEQDNAVRPARVREEGGRSVGLDTRKIDIRARDIDREEGRDMRRAEEFRTRNEGGRSGRPDIEGRDRDALFGAPSDRRDSDVQRGGRERAPESDVREEGRRGRSGEDLRGTSRQPQSRPDVQRDPRREPDRGRYERPRGEEYRMPSPERRGEMRTPERRMEPRRDDAGRSRGDEGRRR